MANEMNDERTNDRVNSRVNNRVNRVINTEETLNTNETNPSVNVSVKVSEDLDKSSQSSSVLSTPFNSSDTEKKEVATKGVTTIPPRTAIAVGAIVWIVPIVSVLIALISMMENHTEKPSKQEVSKQPAWQVNLSDDSNNKSSVSKLVKPQDSQSSQNSRSQSPKNQKIKPNSLQPKPDRLWIIQVATFRNQELANQLNKRVTKLGYNSYIHRSKRLTSGVPISLYSVRFGTFEQKARAEKIVEQIGNQLKVIPVIYQVSHPQSSKTTQKK